MALRSPAMRRFVRTHVVLSALYVACVALASALIPDAAAPSPLVVVLALLPGLVVFGWIANMGRFLTELEDEYLRMLEIRKALIATALTLAVAGGWGLIELFAAVPRLPVFLIFPIWCAGLAVGSLVNRFSDVSVGVGEP